MLVSILGSSPRMRGTHGDRIGLLGHLGIIPAYAGNTRVIRGRRRNLQDHPRVCGEHEVDLFEALCHQGSSPRMRGTLVHTLIT